MVLVFLGVGCLLCFVLFYFICSVLIFLSFFFHLNFNCKDNYKISDKIHKLIKK